MQIARVLAASVLTFSAVDGPVTGGIYQLISSTRNRIKATKITPRGQHEAVVRHGVLDFAFDLPLSTAIVAALPGTFIFIIRQLPSTWATRHQTSVANALHLLAIFSCANQHLQDCDLLVVVFVMVAFDVFQRALGCAAVDATAAGESDRRPQRTSPHETSRAQTRSTRASVSAGSVGTRGLVTALVQRPGSDTSPITFDAKDREIVRLQRSLTESKTAHKATEVQLRIAKEELYNARETLNGTFAEYANLREELKIIKQNLGRDHQAIVYRKDIELFALRKGNEQKDKSIQERDTKLEEMARQHNAAMEVRDAQLKLMKERIISIERQSSPRFSEDKEDGDHALEVRLLKIRKGRNSQGGEEDKDTIIAKLQEQLAKTMKTNEEVVNQQAELQRAWDVAKKIKKALVEERERHAQTQDQLEETAVKLSEADPQSRNRASSSPGRLPTIDEDDHDKNELEAMFDTAQQDNLRLYAEVAALEKRLSDANSRMFTAVQETETLREQMNLEQTVNEDTETARPSIVHRVHFQRMENQLAEVRNTLTNKDEEMELLKNTIVEKDHYVKDIQGELDAAARFHTQDQDEIERLKQSIAELQATKYQLMLDHERQSIQRPRQRVISTDRADRASARSSGATLISELSPSFTRPSDENTATETQPQMPVVLEREDSIQETPVRHLRSKSSPKSNANRWSMISQDIPPPELRELKGTRRRSLGLKEVMQKIVGRNSESAKQDSAEFAAKEEKPVKREESKIRRALAPKDKNDSQRPSTSVSTVPSKPIQQPPALTLVTSPLPQNIRPPHARRHTPNTPRYYAAQDAAVQKQKEDERPHTAAADDSAIRPKSRLSWGAT